MVVVVAQSCGTWNNCLLMVSPWLILISLVLSLRRDLKGLDCSTISAYNKWLHTVHRTQRREVNTRQAIRALVAGTVQLCAVEAVIDTPLFLPMTVFSMATPLVKVESSFGK